MCDTVELTIIELSGSTRTQKLYIMCSEDGVSGLTSIVNPA